MFIRKVRAMQKGIQASVCFLGHSTRSLENDHHPAVNTVLEAGRGVRKLPVPNVPPIRNGPTAITTTSNVMPNGGISSYDQVLLDNGALDAVPMMSAAPMAPTAPMVNVPDNINNPYIMPNWT